MPKDSSSTKTGFSAKERDAMKERAAELKNKGKSAAKGEADVIEKWKAMSPANRAIAEGIHQLVKKLDPAIEAKTWYGMPAYYKNGKLICFFQSADKWKTRYSTLGFDENAKLDSGNSWPTAYAILKLTPDVKRKLTAEISKALGK